MQIKWADDIDLEQYKQRTETIPVGKTPEEKEISESPKDMDVKFYDNLTRRRNTPYIEEDVIRLEKDPTHGGQLTRVFDALQKQIETVDSIEAQLKEIKAKLDEQKKPLEEQKIKLKEDIGDKVRNLTEYLFNAQDSLDELAAENDMVILEYKKMLLYIINKAEDKISTGVPEAKVVEILMDAIQNMGTQEMQDAVSSELNKAIEESRSVQHTLQRELFMAKEPASAKSTKSKGKSGSIYEIITWVKEKFNIISNALSNSLGILKNDVSVLRDVANKLDSLELQTLSSTRRAKIVSMTRYLMEF